MIERAVCNLRREVREGRLRLLSLIYISLKNGRLRLPIFERFIYERENLVLDSLIYLEPVEKF